MQPVQFVLLGQDLSQTFNTSRKGKVRWVLIDATDLRDKVCVLIEPLSCVLSEHIKTSILPSNILVEKHIGIRKMGEASVTTNAITSTKKKKKGFFKSLAKGISFKKKKKHVDDESVVGVALDAKSVVSRADASTTAGSMPRSVGPRGDGAGRKAPAAGGAAAGATRSASNDGSSVNNDVNNFGANPLTKPIQVVLLLMDPASRRFELLQLEFDSNKALVGDVLRQIQCSATETSLRDMDYAGVCDREGNEMIQSQRLAQFCRGNEVVMAMPNGMSGRETANLARPILNDPKVVDMVRLFDQCCFYGLGKSFPGLLFLDE